MPALMFSELYYERNQLSQAEELLAQRDIASRLGFVDNLIAGFTTRSRLQTLQGRYLEAEELLREGAWLATQFGFRRMEAALLDERLRVLLMTDKGLEAQGIYRDFQRSRKLSTPAIPQETSTLEDLHLALAFARDGLSTGNFRDAVTVLKAWFAFTRERRCHRSAIRSGVLLSRALLAAGDRRGALRTLNDSLVLGERGGFVRSFIDEGREIADLVAEIEQLPGHPPDSRFRQYVGVVRRVSGNADDPEALRESTPVHSSSDDGLLSPREIQVIELGARGFQNADIARSLFLAQSTVKWYWQRIFEKLEVRRRPDAIRVARENHWIQ
jgi:LuxR family maltose regulon positive regulatory protein